MPFDGNGNWTSNFSAVADRDANIKILASRFDGILLADIAQSFENCLTKDTQVKPQTNFNANNYRIINLANPEADNDALTYGKFRTGNNTLTGNNTFSGTNTFDNLKLQATRPILLANGNNIEGGEIRFESAPNEATTGIMYIARSNGKFVFVGVDSSQTTKFPFIIDIQTDTVAFSAPAQSGINGKVMPNYTAAVSKTKDVAYIADSNGYLIGWDQYQGTAGSYNAYVYINGVNVRINQTQDNYSTNTWCYPISKGSSYSYSGAASMEMFFVPAIGG